MTKLFIENWLLRADRNIENVISSDNSRGKPRIRPYANKEIKMNNAFGRAKRGQSARFESGFMAHRAQGVGMQFTFMAASSDIQRQPWSYQ